jgi:hypothetical protein
VGVDIGGREGKVVEKKERRRKKCVIIMDGPCVYILENNHLRV